MTAVNAKSQGRKGWNSLLESRKVDMTENEISKYIVESAIEVHRTLGGAGLLENVYCESLMWELRTRGFRSSQSYMSQ